MKIETQWIAPKVDPSDPLRQPGYAAARYTNGKTTYGVLVKYDDRRWFEDLYLDHRAVEKAVRLEAKQELVKILERANIV